MCSPDPPTAFTQYMAVKRNGGTHNSPNCARAFTRVRREGFAVRNCLELPATWHSSRQCNNSKTQVNLTTEKLMRPIFFGSYSKLFFFVVLSTSLTCILQNLTCSRPLAELSMQRCLEASWQVGGLNEGCASSYEVASLSRPG